MLSSTSNSNSRLPEAPYKRIWLLILCLLALALSLSEWLYRQKGFRPSIADTKMYWAIKRDQVYNQPKEKKKIVIVGASRAQLGIVPDSIQDELPGHKVVHLAVGGTQSLYILMDLAQDPNFNGTVFFSMIIPSLDTNNVEAAKPWADYYHNHFDHYGNLGKRYNAWIQATLQQYLITMSTTLRLSEIVRLSFSLKPNYIHMQKSRYRAAYYYDLMTPKELMTHRSKRIKGLKMPTERTDIDHERVFQKLDYKTLITCYRQLKKKGGHLFLIRMPTTGEHWLHDEKFFPKDRLWDRISNITNIPSIHFQDYSELSAYTCPDTSHLDANDSPEFTKNLVKIIKKQYGHQLGW